MEGKGFVSYPPLMARRTFHRSIFFAAGVYNILWGVYSVFDPQWFFRVAGLPLSNHPEIFGCLGMLIGLYGVLYLQIAKSPEAGWWIVEVAFAGKIFGPIAAIWLVAQEVWPGRALLILCVPNDLAWWVPFSLYLHDAWKIRQPASSQQ